MLFMKKLFLFLLAAVPAVLFAQDRVINDPNAEARSVGAFHGIRVSTGIELIMKQGTVEALAVSASDNEARDKIITEVVDGVLKIYFDYKSLPRNTFKNKHLKAYVSFKNIDKFSGASGSNTTVDGSVSISALEMSLSSGAYFKGDVKGSDLTIKQNSGSRLYLSGEVQSLTVDASSGGSVRKS